MITPSQPTRSLPLPRPPGRSPPPSMDLPPPPAIPSCPLPRLPQHICRHQAVRGQEGNKTRLQEDQHQLDSGENQKSLLKLNSRLHLIIEEVTVAAMDVVGEMEMVEEVGAVMVEEAVLEVLEELVV